MNINTIPSIGSDATQQWASDSAISNTSTESAPSKTLEFTPSTNKANLSAQLPLSSHASISNVFQNIMQNLQGLLSQVSGQTQANPASEKSEPSTYSDSLAGFEASNMTSARQPASSSLRSMQGDARVELEGSGHALEDGGRTEVFTVQEGERKRVNDPSEDDGERALRPGEAVNGRTNLDPRVESRFGENISSNGVDDYQFTGQYNITRAKETTIFQMLNIDRSEMDMQRPVLFLEAYTYEDEDGNKRVRITDGAAEPTTLEELEDEIETAQRRLNNTTEQSERTELRNTINEARDEIGRRSNPELGFSEFPVAYDGPTTFDLEVNTNGRRAGIRIKPANDENAATQSYSAEFDRDRSTSDADLGDFSTVRYGAYHHDGEGTEPIQSTARLRVTDANLSRNQPE